MAQPLIEGTLLKLKDLSPRPWHSLYQEKLVPASEALKAIRRGHRVFIGSGCGEPQHLAQCLEEVIPQLSDLEILHILSVGQTRYTEEQFFDKCRLKSFFCGGGHA